MARPDIIHARLRMLITHKRNKFRLSVDEIAPLLSQRLGYDVTAQLLRQKMCGDKPITMEERLVLLGLLEDDEGIELVGDLLGVDFIPRRVRHSQSRRLGEAGRSYGKVSYLRVAS